LKRVLIISPYFPPTNAADMQRVRMSLPYFRDYGWEAEIVAVHWKYTDLQQDDLLLEMVPEDIIIHRVKPLDKRLTSKFGLGSIALRSIAAYRKCVNLLLREKKYDLIYFSTTQFPICILGCYWKNKFNIPFVIDLQDPWHSNYYEDKPKNQRPKKYWLSYRFNKYLEPLAFRSVDGIISVSESYITEIKKRYPGLKDVPSSTITFGAYSPDIQIAIKNKDKFPSLLQPGYKNLVYIGRGGQDMHKAITPLFAALKTGLTKYPLLFSQLKLYFIGTSYAAPGQGEQTIRPLAKDYGIEDQVIESTDRVSYYQTLSTLQQADALFIPGSDDPSYTASKIYPYLLAKRPLLAIVNAESSIIRIVQEYNVKSIYTYDNTPDIIEKIVTFLRQIVTDDLEIPDYNENAIKKYGAKNMTAKQCILFDNVLERTQ